MNKEELAKYEEWCKTVGNTSKAMMYKPNLPDSGNRQEFETGAVRDIQEGKGRFDLIPPEAIFRLAKLYEAGAIKYDARNWEKGIPISRCLDSCFRHLYKYLAGLKDEDHLASAMWNIASIMHYERYNPDMQDLNMAWRENNNLIIKGD